MYKSYFQKDGKTYALDKTGKFNVIKTTDNVEEILITKNNIEEIENISLNVNESMKQIKVEFIFDFSKFITLDVVSTLFIILSFPLLIKVLAGILLLGSSILTIKELEQYSKYKKEYYSKTDILDKMLTLEKSKLNVLEKNAKKIDISENTKEKNIDTSEKIKELYKKLELISYYTQNHLKIHYLFNNYGEDYLKKYLKEKYSNENIDFIIFLINLTERKHNIENNKVKKI